MPIPGVVASARRITTFPTANLVARYDFSDSANYTLTSGFVSTLNDLSGNGRNLTQATSTARPSITTNAQNGLSVGNFDGTNDFLTRTSFSLAMNAASIYSVFNLTVQNGDTIAFIGTLSAGRLRSFWDNLTGNMSNGLFNGSSSTVRSASQSGYNAWGLVNAASGTNPFTENFNSTRTTGLGYTGSFTSITTPTIGLGGTATSDACSVRIGEALFYSTEHSTTDQDAVMSYLKYKWGTP
jgi:hypothetical protein